MSKKKIENYCTASEKKEKLLLDNKVSVNQQCHVIAKKAKGYWTIIWR